MLDTFREPNSESKTLEARLVTGTCQSKMDLEKVIEGMPAWVQVCGLDGTIELVNRAATRISGYEREEMEGQHWPYPWLAESGSPSAAAAGWATGSWPYAELERSGYVPEFEVTCITPQNSTLILGVTMSLLRDELDRPQNVLMVAWDHTQRKAREAEVGLAQKFQAVGQLASGISHDINNNLAVILGYSEFLLGTSESFGEVVRQALSAIQEQSVDCANTIRRIQLFSRSVHKSQFSGFSVNDLVREVISSTQSAPGGWKYRSEKEGIDIRVETELADLRPIYAYQEGLKETLTSLVHNAVDALPEGGVISFKTKECDQGALVEVSDNGVGIAQADLHRIFDAFYTTKGPASSGLGLSIAYNLISQQGGKISVSSQEGQGSTFVIQIPYATGVPVDKGTPGRRLAVDKALSVLVVDDEPMVADVFRTFLESFGHQVFTCLSGADALEIFKRREFDMALVDLGMPGMDGWEVAQRVNLLCPDFPIIVATGWNVSVEDGLERGAKVRAVLKKPFGMHDLVRAVEEALR